MSHAENDNSFRMEKSLGLLTKKFVALLRNSEDGVLDLNTVVLIHSHIQDARSVLKRCQDTSDPGHFGPKTFRHYQTGAEVSGQFGTGAEVSYGHFGTSAEMSWVRSVLGPKCLDTVIIGSVETLHRTNRTNRP